MDDWCGKGCLNYSNIVILSDDATDQANTNISMMFARDDKFCNNPRNVLIETPVDIMQQIENMGIPNAEDTVAVLDFFP